MQNLEFLNVLPLSLDELLDEVGRLAHRLLAPRPTAGRTPAKAHEGSPARGDRSRDGVDARHEAAWSHGCRCCAERGRARVVRVEACRRRGREMKVLAGRIGRDGREWVVNAGPARDGRPAKVHRRRRRQQVEQERDGVEDLAARGSALLQN